MPIVVYKCDVCKREIQLQRNIDGLETISRCVITHGCRGKLYHQKVLQDYIRGTLPEDVTGLENWLQRKVLHNHTQAIERQEWIIEHNLGTFPSVSVFVDRPIEGDLDNREEITPTDVEIVDPDTLLLRFERPWSGIAQLVARASDPNLLQPFVREAEEVILPQQISNNGAITIATQISSIGERSTISLRIRYQLANNEFRVITYPVDDQPSTNSPWVDFDKVVVKGKVYTVRSFNGIVAEMTTGVIVSGTNFRFTSIDKTGNEFVSINPNEVLILLANEPFETVDKIKDRFVDVTSVTSTKNPFALAYDAGEFFANEEIIEPVYPLIRSI